ncbi:MAG TPA: hypothetical protein PKD63_03990 [Solirubrobacteraceae bacterium]|nr:hypothetical protein [Solirubrobacteraceae bacterium]
MTFARVLLAGIAAAALLLVLQASSAHGAWRTPAGAGTGASGAQRLPAGTQPTALAGGARSVALSWSAPTGIPAGARYRVVRTPSGGGAAIAVCDQVSATSCSDTAVPTGAWHYAVAVTLGAWAGASGTTSSAVTIAAPAMTLSTATVSGLPGATDATLTGFAASETITFRLDSASGTVLTTSPAATTTSAAGGGTGRLAIPAGTAAGAHPVHAIGARTLRPTATVTVSLPTPTLILASSTFATLPATTTATVAAFGANEPVTFRLDAADGTSIGSATANAAGGASGSITVPAGVSSGAHTVYAVGSAGSGATQAFTVSGLGASPSALAFTNGGTSRRPDQRDTVTLTFNRELQPRSICSAWSATSASAGTSGTVRLYTPTGGRNTLEITAMSGCTSFAFGAIDLGRTNMTSATGTVATFTGATIAWSAANRRITITLNNNGTVTGGTLLRAGSSSTAAATYTPAPALRALSGVAVTGTFTTSALVPF